MKLPSFYICCVGSPGTGKSLALEIVKQAFSKHAIEFVHCGEHNLKVNVHIPTPRRLKIKKGK